MAEPSEREMLKAMSYVLVKGFIRTETQRRRRQFPKRARKAEGAVGPQPRIVPEESFVYVIGCAGNPVKIGMAKNPDSRLAELQTGFPHKLRVYARFAVPLDMASQIERRAHAILSTKRLNGEWFDASREEAEDAVMIAIQQIVPAA